MLTIELSEGSVLFARDEPVEHVSLIVDGEVEGSFGGHKFLLGKSDVLGLSNLTGGFYSHTFTAISDVTLYQYPCTDTRTMDALLRGNSDIAYLMVSSVCRQVAELLKYRSRLTQDVDTAYDLTQDIYAEYSRLCKMYASTPKKLPGFEDISKFSGSDFVEGWVRNQYIEINDLGSTAHKMFFHGNPGITSGFLRRCLEDISNILQACNAYHDYLERV